MALNLTYQAVGNAEDISDIIDAIDYTKTPTYSEARKVRATGIVHQWQFDEFAPPSTAGTVEGTDVTYTTAAQPTLTSNACQIFRKQFGVSKTEEAVKKYGRKSEYKRLQKKRVVELKRDINETIWQGSGASNSGTSATARQMAKLPAFISASQTAGQTAKISLSQVNLALEDVWNNGTDPDTIWTTGKIKSYISNWSINNLTRNVQASTHKAVWRIDVLDSDFGMVEIIPDRNQATGVLVAGIKELIRIADLRKPVVQSTPDLGGGPRAFVECESTLEVGHPKGFSIITGITASV